MTLVINDINPRIQYTAGAAQDTFPYPFPIFEDSDIVVDIDGDVKTLTTDYTVTNAGESAGGDVVLVAPATGGEIITIYRDVPVERTTDFQQNGQYRSSVINLELDRIVAMIQQLARDIGRSVKVSIVSDNPDELTPAPNTVIGYDADTNLELFRVEDIFDRVGFSIIKTPLQILDGDTVVSVPEINDQTADQIAVILNGATIRDGYTATPGTLTFDNPTSGEFWALIQYTTPIGATTAGAVTDTSRGQSVQDTLDQLSSIFAPIVATLEALATDLSAVNVFQSTTYTAGLSDSVAISWRATGATNAGSAGTTDFANGKLYDSVGTEFEYANEIIYVDALGGEVQNALDYAGSFGFPKIVHCGDQYVTTTVTVPQNVHFTTGRVTYDGVDTDIPIVKMGDNAAGTTLTRTAKISFIRAKDESGLAGIVGFQIGNYVRTSSIENCVAEMSEPVDQSLGQVGFEIASWYIGAPGITNTGTYGNTIKSCLALFAHTGFRARTFGTKANELSGPEANGNWILDCHAFSCRARALHLSYGAQENIVDIRADTFPSQIGLGTRIDVIAVDGRYNKVHLVEEIGPRADTQYSVMIGDEAIYNEIDFSTQQIVTGAIDDSLSPAGKRAKNIIRQTGTALISKGRSGSESSEGFYAAVAAGQTQAAQKIWIAPAKCVVTYVAGRLNTTAPLGGDTRIYFAKNASYATNNRLVWSASEAVSVKSITTDTSAGTDIGTRWVLDPGDFITMAVDTPGGGGVTVTGTMFVRYI